MNGGPEIEPMDNYRLIDDGTRRLAPDLNQHVGKEEISFIGIGTVGASRVSRDIVPL